MSEQQKVSVGEMIALADDDLSDAISMGLARQTWGRPNTAKEDRAIAVRRALLATLRLLAEHEGAVREAIKKATAGRSAA